MAWKTSYYHFDAVGNTRMLTDADQNVRTSYSQTAFGEQLAESNEVTNPFRFVGQLGYYFDVATELLNVRERVYDAGLGRWLSEDQERIDENLYRYALNSPLMLIDPTGLAPEWHHLLPNQFAPYWRTADIDQNAKEYGWILDDVYHRLGPGGTVHPTWNRDWERFVRANPQASREGILTFLESMKRKYSQVLRNGKPALLSNSEWHAWRRFLAETAARSKTTKTTIKIKLPARSIVDKFGKVIKLVPVIVFAYTASTDSVSVAAEQGTEDALWPFLDIARAASEPFSSFVHEATVTGRTNRQIRTRWSQELLADPSHAEIPLHP